MVYRKMKEIAVTVIISVLVPVPFPFAFAFEISILVSVAWISVSRSLCLAVTGLSVWKGLYPHILLFDTLAKRCTTSLVIQGLEFGKVLNKRYSLHHVKHVPLRGPG